MSFKHHFTSRIMDFLKSFLAALIHEFGTAHFAAEITSI
jgi:hypothetical protein